MGKKKYPARMAAFMAAYYGANSVYQSYMSLYYTSLGFGPARVGMISAAVAVSSLAGQPFWGARADRSPSRRRLIACLALASAGVAPVFLLAGRFMTVTALAAVFAFFYTAIQPMGDSVMLERLNGGGHPFGPLRLCGCAAFALAGQVFGRIMDGGGRERLVPAAVAIMCVLTAVSALSLPSAPGGQADGGRVSLTRLAGQKDLIKLLAFMAPVQVTMGYFYTFFSPHFVSLRGGSESLLGTCYLISAVSEIPFLLAADKLFERFGAGRLMCSAALSLTARWLILAMGHTAGAAMFSQVFHGWGFIVMTVCMAKFISRTVPKELRASGQMLLAVVSFGIARVVGNLGGGFLAEAVGRQNVFFVCAGICLAALCAFAPGCLRRPPMNGAEG